MRSPETVSVVEHLGALRRYALSLTRDIDEEEAKIRTANAENIVNPERPEAVEA